LLSSSETRVNFGIKSKKKAHLHQLNASKPLVTSISQKRKTRGPIHCGLEIGKSQPRSKLGNFEGMSWLNGSFFIGVF
jgi:hypothetical protein